MTSGREVGAEIRNAILRLAIAGNSKAEVVRRLGVSMTTVTRFWPTPPKRRTNDKTSQSLK